MFETLLIARPTKRTLASVCSRDAFWMGVLAFVNVLFFSDVLFTDRTFFVRDVSTFHYPLKKLVTEAYARGEWPLWNPYVQLGQPLLANPNSMAVYPGQLLFQLLPFELAFELHFVVHCALAGMGAFCLARQLGLSLQAAFLSAVVYNFSGLSLSAVNLFNILPVAAFLPWLSVALLWLLSKPSVPRECVTALLLGIFFLLLEPLSTLATGIFLLVLVLAFVWRSGKANFSTLRLSRIAAFVLLAATSVAAIQILPTLELVQFSSRRGGLSFSEATFWSLHPVQLLQVVCPRILGEYFRLEAPVPWPAPFFDHREPYLLSCYFGGLTLLLAAWGGWRSRANWRTELLLVATVVSVLLALGTHTPLYSLLFEWIPAFRYGRFPVKFLFVTNLCVSLLAGTGWAALQSSEDASHDRRSLWCVAALLLVFSAGLATLYIEPMWGLLGATQTATGEFQWLSEGNPVRIGANLLFGGLRHVHLHIAAFLALLLLKNWRALRPDLLGLSVVLVVVIDLWTSNFWISPPGDSKLYETAPIARYLQERDKTQGPFRIYRFEPAQLSAHPSIRYETDSVIWIALYRKLTLFPFLGAKDHIAYSLFPSVDRLETPFVQRLSHDVENNADLNKRIDILSRLNVDYVVSPVEMASDRVNLEALFQVNSDQPARLYKLKTSVPRAVLISQEPHFAGSPAPTLLASPADNDHQGLRSLGLGESVESASVKIYKYAPHEVEMNVESPQGGLVVLLDNNYPGWVARVDGEVRPIQEIHPATRVVGVSGGEHHVTLSFEPASFRRGLTISAISVLVLVAIVGTHALKQATSRSIEF